jgi:hypothetical protein
MSLLNAYHFYVSHKRSTIFLLIGLMLVCSFFCYSFVFSPYFNSDDAIHVLMAYEFRFPEDLYYWGQDRLGSFLPLFTFITSKILFFIPLIVLISIWNYVFLFGLFWAISTFFKTNLSKIILAIILFFPPFAFKEMVNAVHPYLLQFFFIFVALRLIDKIRFSEKTQDKRFILYTIQAVIYSFIAIWISDFSIGILLTFIFCYVIFLFHFESNAQGFILKFFKPNFNYLWLVAALATIPCVYFIYYAKNNALPTEAYSTFNTIEELREVLKRLVSMFIDLITFNDANKLWCFHAVFFIFIIICLARSSNNRVDDIRIRFWHVFFITTTLLIFFLLVLSKWVYNNDLSMRFFVNLYVFAWVGLLFYVENYKKAQLNFLQSLLLLLALISAISLLKQRFSERSVYLQIKPLEKLAPLGLIGDYWSSYVFGAVNPQLIKGTPHLNSYVRSPQLVNEAMKNKIIYLVKNRWFESFEDSTYQYGHLLKSEHQPIKLGEYELERYRVEKRIQTLNYQSLYSHGRIVDDSLSISKKVLLGDSLNNALHIVFGPYIANFPPGKYKCVYRIKVDNNGIAEEVAHLGITKNKGELIALRIITGKEFETPYKYQNFEVVFEISNEISMVEFLVYYLGKNKMWVDQIHYEKIN